jgi:hypothetical protein
MIPHFLLIPLLVNMPRVRPRKTSQKVRRKLKTKTGRFGRKTEKSTTKSEVIQK